MKLDYNKSNSFRVAKIDEFRIELTPNLDIQLAEEISITYYSLPMHR